MLALTASRLVAGMELYINYTYKHKNLHCKSNELYCSDIPMERVLLSISALILGTH